MDEVSKYYIALIRDFLSGKSSAESFKKEFFSSFKKEDGASDGIFEILNDLFYAVEDYVSDPVLREEGDLDEAGLAEAAQKTYDILTSSSGRKN